MVIAMAAYGLYALVCVVAIFVVNSRVSLANRLVQGDTTVTVDQATAADDNVSAMAVILLVAILFLLVAVILSGRDIRKAIGRQGVRRVQRQSGIWIVSILWALVWVVGTVTANNTPDNPQALVSADHRTMFLLGARAVLILVIAALTPVMYRKAQAELGSSVAAQPYSAPLGY